MSTIDRRTNHATRLIVASAQRMLSAGHITGAAADRALTEHRVPAAVVRRVVHDNPPDSPARHRSNTP